MDCITQIEQYLNDPDRMARFRAKLLTALHDPGWANSRNTFDWLRFAREFTTPDFDPPLESMTFFSFLLKPHFAQTWHIVPRSRTWWLLRLGEDATEPVIWLHQQCFLQRRGEMVRIAERLNHPAITNQKLATFLYQHKHPAIPGGFLAAGQRLLILSDSNPAAAWGVAARPVKQARQQGLAWQVVLCEPLLPLLNNHDCILLRQPVPSLRAAVDDILEQRDFQPDQILLYSGLFTVNGQIVRNNPDWNSIERASFTWPRLVEGWDEDGWPVCRPVINSS